MGPYVWRAMWSPLCPRSSSISECRQPSCNGRVEMPSCCAAVTVAMAEHVRERIYQVSPVVDRAVFFVK